MNIASIDSTKGGQATPHLGARGISAARNLLGDRLGAHKTRAMQTYEAALTDLPQRIGGHDSQERALEAARAAERFGRDADSAKKGSIDLDALRDAMNRRMAPPPGFGGPGGKIQMP